MVPLDAAATWTRMLSVTAGARAAAGAPGPATRLRGKAAQEWGVGPWLALIDFQGVRRAEREVLEPWLRDHAERLLLVRHLLLARPLTGDVFIELTPRALEAMPQGFRDAARPILVLSPAGRARPERAREYVEALSRLRIPLTSAGSSLWAIREYDVDLLVALAQLEDPERRAALRAEVDQSQRHLFDQQLPLAKAAVLDDLAGGRDEPGELELDMESVSLLHAQAHPLTVYAAVERAHNRRKSEEERTRFSARTIEARFSARGFPDEARACPPEFAAQALALSPLLPTELQRVFEACELLGRI